MKEPHVPVKFQGATLAGNAVLLARAKNAEAQVEHLTKQLQRATDLATHPLVVMPAEAGELLARATRAEDALARANAALEQSKAALLRAELTLESIRSLADAERPHKKFSLTEDHGQHPAT